MITRLNHSIAVHLDQQSPEVELSILCSVGAVDYSTLMLGETCISGPFRHVPIGNVEDLEGAVLKVVTLVPLVSATQAGKNVYLDFLINQKAHRVEGRPMEVGALVSSYIFSTSLTFSVMPYLTQERVDMKKQLLLV